MALKELVLGVNWKQQMDPFSSSFLLLPPPLLMCLPEPQVSSPINAPGSVPPHVPINPNLLPTLSL